MINLDLINVLVASVAVINTLYGLVVYSRNRSDTTNQSFFFLTLCVSFWGVSMFVYRGFADEFLSLWGSRALYATAAMIPFASLYFSSIFPAGKIKLNFAQRYVWPVPFIIVFILSLLPTGGLIDGVSLRAGQEPFIHFEQIWHSLYALYIMGYFGWVYLILFTKLFRYQGVMRVQIGYILAGTLTTTGIAVFTNLLMPYFGIFTFNWVGQIGILAMITSIVYAILKHHLFNIKIIATELLVLTLCLILFSQIFFATELNERLLAVGVFVVAALIGVLLVRSVIREVETREEIERLAKELEVKNAKLTELDRLKSEFLSIASHDLRTPITAIRNFVSLLREGMFGKVPAAAEDGLRQVFERATDMTKLVENYLNVSRIEQGKMKYDFVSANFTRLVQDAASFYKDGAEKKGLTLTLTVLPGAEALMAKLDTSKINEVVNNLIDNSIKYTLKGSIALTLEKVGSKARLTLKDTGVGMSQKTMSGLFKLFSPGEQSKKINPTSTGVGLYITKAHVDAHKGTLTPTSAGEGKGTQFVLELPLSN